MRENHVEKRSEWRSEPAVERRTGQGEFATDPLEVALAERFYRTVVDGEPERDTQKSAAASSFRLRSTSPDVRASWRDRSAGKARLSRNPIIDSGGRYIVHSVD